MNENFPTDFSRAVNAEIRSWMGRRGLNQKQLADAAGISKSKMSRILGTAEQSMDTDELDVICQVLDVSPAQVVDDAVRAVLAAQRAEAEHQRPARTITQRNLALAANHERRRHEDAQEADYY